MNANLFKSFSVTLNRAKIFLKKLSQAFDILQQIHKIAAYKALLEVLKDERYADSRHLAHYGLKVHSQFNEDGTIHEIFNRIGVSDDKSFLQIGVSHGFESNTLYLLRQGWNGVWVDADRSYIDQINANFNRYITTKNLRVAHAFVTNENINQIYDFSTGNGCLDLLSIDVDGNDYTLLESIVNLRARVIVLKYNPVFHPPIQWIIPYDPIHTWTVGSDHYSASLTSFQILLDSKGYILVACTLNGNNAFFVRKDLASSNFIGDGPAAFHFEPQRFCLTTAYAKGHSFLPKSDL